jgi:hypothetical protein
VLFVLNHFCNALFSKKPKNPWFWGFFGFFPSEGMQVMLLGCITSKTKNPKNPKNPKNNWFKPMVFSCQPCITDVNPDRVTLSGFSAEAVFAEGVHLSHSKLFIGIGIFTAGSIKQIK